MNKSDEILDQIKELLIDYQTPGEEDFHKMSNELKSRLDIGIYMKDELPDGMEMADILLICADISWDAMESSGVSTSITGNEIIEKINDVISPIYDAKNRAMNYRDYATAFSQISKRLRKIAMDTLKEGDRIK